MSKLIIICADELQIKNTNLWSRTTKCMRDCVSDELPPVQLMLCYKIADKKRELNYSRQEERDQLQ